MGKKRATKKRTPKRSAKKAKLQAGPKGRNRGVRAVKVSQIIPNPKNFRTHGEHQREAFEGAVDEIGWYGYPDVFVHPDHPEQFMLVDGELRQDHLLEQYGPDAIIEVNVTNFTPEEADIALATKDPLSAMAGTAGAKLDELLSGMADVGPQLDDLMSSLSDQAFESMNSSGKKGAPTGNPDPGVLGKSHRTLTAILTDEQHSLIMDAINKAKKKYRLDTTAEALATICKEWKKTAG